MSSSTSRLRTPISEQERAGDRGADVAAEVLEAGDPRVDRLRRDREAGGEREDDRRVAEREEEADAHRALAVLQELARRVVDRGDVVGVEGVTQAERVRERAQAGERRVVARVVEEQAEAEQVQEEHAAGEPSETRPLGRAQRLSPGAPTASGGRIQRDCDFLLRHGSTSFGDQNARTSSEQALSWRLSRPIRNNTRAGSEPVVIGVRSVREVVASLGQVLMLSRSQRCGWRRIRRRCRGRIRSAGRAEPTSWQ